MKKRHRIVQVFVQYSNKAISIACACILVTTALVQAQDQEPFYRLGPGDRVKITVFGHEDLSGEFEVNGAGQLTLPLIKHVLVAGLNVQEVEQLVIDLARAEMPYTCPHGRPTVIFMSYQELDKKFGRV